VNGNALLGCRVPVLVVSPFTRSNNPARPRINSVLYDHTSVLKLIEWRYNLPPLTKRDASSEIGNLVSALNLSNPDYSVPSLPAAPVPIPTPCGLFQLGSQIDNESYDFYNLLKSELTSGWKLL
jgi:phospholipase C